MFCENCGKATDAGAAFCEHCGAPQSVRPQPAKPKISVLEALKTFHKAHKYVLPGIAAALVLVVAIILTVSILGRQVAVSDYLQVSVTGFEGHGQLSYQFDEISFAMRLIGLKEFDGYGDADMEDEEFLALTNAHQQALAQLDPLMQSLEITAKLPDGRTENSLQNGDVVTITISMNEKKAEKLDVSLKKLTYEFTVSGLRETVSYSPLDNFDLVFSGYDSIGQYELVCTKTEEKDLGDVIFTTTAGGDDIQVYYKEDGRCETLDVYVEKNQTDLSNGDTLQIYMNVSVNRWLSSGIVLSGTRKEVVVFGLVPMQEADLLSNIRIRFDGIEGDGTATVEYLEEKLTVGELTFDFKEGDIYQGDQYVSSFSFSFSSRNLSNGEEISVQLSVNEQRLLPYGIQVSTTQKTVTVSNLASHASDLDSIRGKLIQVTADAKTVLMDWLYDSWNSAVHDSFFGAPSDQKIISEPELYKTVLTTAKSTTSSTRNTLWLIFKATLNDSKLETPTELYFALCLENVAVRPDGTVYLTDTGFEKYAAEESYDVIYEEYIQNYNVNIF